MAITCACDSGVLAMGLPSCYVIPHRIKKLVFTTRLTPLREVRYPTLSNNIFLALSGPNNEPSWHYEIPNSPIPTSIGQNYEYFLYYKDTYKLQTPLLDDFSTERGEPITEEIGGTAYYVRDADRTMTATLVAKPAEFLRFVEQLRCQNELGVFLIDEKGIVWAKRESWSFTGTRHISPIPVQPATISTNLMFPNSTQVQKIMFSFSLDRTFSDYEFVPVMNSNAYLDMNHPVPLSYSSPLHLVGDARITTNNDLELRLYYEIATSAGVITIPLTNTDLGTYLPSVYNSSGVVVSGPNTWSYIANGIYQISPAPTGARFIRFAPAELDNIPPLNIDAYGFLVRI